MFFKVFIIIHVTNLGASDGQESVIECSFVNILINHEQLPCCCFFLFSAMRLCVLCAHMLIL